MSQFFYNQRENLVNDAIGVSLEIGNFLYVKRII
jgi:hypothetical protein